MSAAEPWVFASIAIRSEGAAQAPAYEDDKRCAPPSYSVFMPQTVLPDRICEKYLIVTKQIFERFLTE